MGARVSGGGGGGLQEDFDFKKSVRAATTAALTLATDFENGDTVDGVVLATGDRVLIKNQVAGSANGIYTINATGAPTRASDADASADVTAGLLVPVEEGTANADTTWQLTTNNPITLGTTALTFAQYGEAIVVAGAGLTKTGVTLDVVGDASITVAADSIGLAAGVAGAGLTLTTGVLDVVAGTGITVNANDVAVTDPVPVHPSKRPVRAATTAAGTLASDFENADTIDGVTLATGDRILIKDQAAGADNGIYTVNASGAPTRATDADASADVVSGMMVVVSEGTANLDTVWLLTTNGVITLGTTALAFSRVGGATNYFAGGTDVAVADGGTGSSTAAGARTNLGAAASGANADITSMTGITGNITVEGTIFNNTIEGRAANAAMRINTTTTTDTTNPGLRVVGNSDYSAASGVQTHLSAVQSINQTSTAGYTTILANVTETAVGSGVKRLLDLQVGAASKMNVDNAGSITLATGQALRTGVTAADTLLLQARDVDGSAYTTFATLTANNTPTMDLAAAVTQAGAVIYRVGGTDVALADGGTGASLVDPNADRILFWDDSESATAFLTAGTGLTITGTTIDATSPANSMKTAVRVATTTAGTFATSFANGQNVDGVTLATGDRILLKSQAATAENGIYTVNASGAPTRATDANTAALLLPGTTVQSNSGTVNADLFWQLTTDAPITLDTTGLTWQAMAYSVIMDEYVNQTRRPKLNFVGATVAVTDSPGDNATIVTHTAAALGANADITSASGFTGAISKPTTITVATAGGLRTDVGAGNTALLQAYDVDGAAYTTMATLTANNTPTLDLNTGATIGGAAIYRAAGTDVALADGGTGASLVDPNADRILFWDDSESTTAFLTAGSGLTITGTTITASGGVSDADTWKAPVRVATVIAHTMATDFANAQSVDGITLATGDRILIKNQASALTNGIYTVNASGAPTRATDADASSEVVPGITVHVSEGTVNADSTWTLTTNATITLDTTALTFEPIDKKALADPWKTPCKCATTIPNTLGGGAYAAGGAIDGYTLVTGDRILIKDQATSSENGIYDITAGTPTRSTDSDTSAKFPGGCVVAVTNGTANGDTVWMMTNSGAITLGTTALVFGQVGGNTSLRPAGRGSPGATLLLQAFDSDAETWTTFGTLTTNNDPTFDLSASTTIGTKKFGSVLVESKTITVATNSVVFSSLAGDTDKLYQLVASIRKAAGTANGDFRLHPNSGAATRGVFSGTVDGATPSASATAYWALTNGNVPADAEVFVEANVWAAKTINSVARNRSFTGMSSVQTSTTAVTSFLLGGMWNESTTNITSLQVLSQGAAEIDNGSFLNLYKLAS